MAVRYGLFRDVLHHAQADVVVELVHVHGIIGQISRGAAFQRQHADRSSAHQFLGHGQAGPAAADDGDINRFKVGHGCLYSMSFRMTFPPFITNLTRCSSVMSTSGSLETAIKSAYLPLSMDPIWSCHPSTSALI